MRSIRNVLAVGIVGALAMTANAATVYDLTFDELPFNTPLAPSVSVEGVTIIYTGAPGGATYSTNPNAPGAPPNSIYPGIFTPFLEGDASGTVRFAFDQAVGEVIFNIGLFTFFDNPIDYGVTIEFTDAAPISLFRDISTFGTLPAETFQYTSTSQNISAVQIAFADRVQRFAIDNLLATTNVVPEASTLALMGLASVGGLGMMTWRRRKAG